MQRWNKYISINKSKQPTLSALKTIAVLFEPSGQSPLTDILWILLQGDIYTYPNRPSIHTRAYAPSLTYTQLYIYHFTLPCDGSLTLL